MNSYINVKRKDGVLKKAKFQFMNENDLDKIMEFQEKIYKDLEDKQLYSKSRREEFSEFICNKGKIIGCITKDEELIAIAVYCKLGFESDNYGYDIGIKGDELLKVGQIEATLVDKNYRGNRLQKKMCIILEKIGIEQGTPIMTATASPYNEFSVNTFRSLGYEVAIDKLKYGGLRRYVFIKRL